MPGDIIFVMMKKWLVLLLVFFLLESFGTQGISPAETPQQNQFYVANTENDCVGYTNCFFNDSTDLPESNALAKAVKFARDNTLTDATINILSPYEMNSHFIQVDYPVTIIGKNGGWISTSTSDCSRPMFVISAQATIRDISLNDGASDSPSRDLLVVNSPSPVIIEHSTFENGQTAISYQAGAGDLTVQFSHLNNNQVAINSTNTDLDANLLVVANNITSSSTSAQVSCAGNSFVDHNFWGTGVLPSQSAVGCGADNAKRLDAPIVIENTGVGARLLSLTNTLPATDFYGFKASSSNPVGLYVVNHGDSTPFSSSAGSPYHCSNFFDVFLPPSASPGTITLSLAYRDANDCAPIIQSAAYCGSGNQTRFPLLWYDPKTQVTDKWDKTGDIPQSSVGSIYAGQETTCRTASKTIEVIVDNNGRPDLLNDLFFTPFVIGYEQAGVLSFTASATTSSINLNWTTVTEVNTLNFHIARSTTSDGTYEKISGDIAATGSPSSGSSYSFSDSTAVAGQTYYYKLVVINSDGSVQQMVGPVSATVAPLPAATNTLTTTRTITPTRTLTPFRTATSAFKTPLPDEPTLFLPTFTDTPTTEITPDLSLTPADTPTPTSTPSRTPTPTVSGTPNSGLLGKTDRYSGQKQVPFYLGGVAVLILLVLLAVYIHRKQ
jgi:hypothetical protein